MEWRNDIWQKSDGASDENLVKMMTFQIGSTELTKMYAFSPVVVINR